MFFPGHSLLLLSSALWDRAAWALILSSSEGLLGTAEAVCSCNSACCGELGYILNFLAHRMCPLDIFVPKLWCKWCCLGSWSIRCVAHLFIVEALRNTDAEILSSALRSGFMWIFHINNPPSGEMQLLISLNIDFKRIKYRFKNRWKVLVEFKWWGI